MSGLLRNPLLHFLAIGAGIYLAYGLVSRGAGQPEDDRTIVVGAPELRWLETSWEKRWNRLPTPAERQGLIDEYVRETVLYREALAMGLDRDDTIIRRRLAQKLEFLSQDLAPVPEPGDQELLDYLAANGEKYATPARATLTHVFIDPDRRGDQTLEDAERIKAALAERGEPVDGVDDLGDAFMLQSYYPERAQPELSKLFGREFAEAVLDLEPGAWHGPVLSGYGVHLVYVHSRADSQPAVLADVRDAVLRDWQDEARREFNKRFYQGLRDRYEVIVVEGESPNEVASAAGEAR